MPPTVELAAAASPEAHRHLDGALRELQQALRLALHGEDGQDAAIDRGLAAYDRYLELVTAAHPMSCRPGCTACCMDNPRGVTGIEIERIAEVVAAFPDAATVRASFSRLAALRTDEASWRSRRKPCPLLDDTGACRAYARRPIACRAFWALTPARQCDPEDSGYAERVNPHLDPPKVIVQILRALSEIRGLTVSTDLHTGMAG